MENAGEGTMKMTTRAFVKQLSLLIISAFPAGGARAVAQEISEPPSYFCGTAYIALYILGQVSRHVEPGPLF